MIKKLDTFYTLKHSSHLFLHKYLRYMLTGTIQVEPFTVLTVSDNNIFIFGLYRTFHSWKIVVAHNKKQEIQF